MDGTPVTAEIAWLAEALGQERQYGQKLMISRQHRGHHAKTITLKLKGPTPGAGVIGKPLVYTPFNRMPEANGRKTRRGSR